MGTPEPSGPEILGQGIEPEQDDVDPYASRAPLRLPRGAWTVVVVLALVLGGAWYAGRPDLGGHALPSTSVSSPERDQIPTPDATALVSGLAERHDLTAPAAPAQDSFIATTGHVLLFLQISNHGARPLRIIAGSVPQDGVSRDLTAGGLSAGTSNASPLRPGDQTEVFLRLTLRCTSALQGSAATAVLLVAEQVGQSPHLERVSLDALGPFWDEARHAACQPPDIARDVTASVVPHSVRAARADDGSLLVSAVLRFHDAAGFAAVLTGPALSAGGGGRLVVDGGSTQAVPMRWSAGTCSAPAVPVTQDAAPRWTADLPTMTGSSRVDLAPDFAAEWTAQVRAACSRTSA
jgi:hypothetical protein